MHPGWWWFWSLSRAQLFAAPRTVARQAFPGKKWSGLSFPSPGDLLNPHVYPSPLQTSLPSRLPHSIVILLLYRNIFAAISALEGGFSLARQEMQTRNTETHLCREVLKARQWKRGGELHLWAKPRTWRCAGESSRTCRRGWEQCFLVCTEIF